MTTQPTEAVGSVAGPDTGNASEPTLEERFAALSADDTFDDTEAEDEGEEAEDDATPQGDDEAGDDAPDAESDDAEQETEDETPSIKPPASMTPEEKEAFANWPADAQEFATRRIGDLEKGFHAKTQQFAQEKAQIEVKGLAEIQTMSAQYAQTLQQLLPPIPERPSPRLQVEDPIAWAEQQEYYDWAVAQHGNVQQAFQFASTVAHQAEQEQARRQEAASVAILQAQFPEYLDPSASIEHRKVLGTIASELGFTAEELQAPNARDVLALRKIGEWKADAEKWRKHNVDKMAVVRAAKGAPKISRPGQPQAAGQARQRAMQNDREAMRRGDRDAAARVFRNFV